MRALSIIELLSVIFLNFIISTNYSVLLALLIVFADILAIVFTIFRYTFFNLITDTLVDCATVVIVDSFLLHRFIADNFALIFVVLVVLQIDSLILFETEFILVDQLRLVVLDFAHVVDVGFVVVVVFRSLLWLFWKIAAIINIVIIAFVVLIIVLRCLHFDWLIWLRIILLKHYWLWFLLF